MLAMCTSLILGKDSEGWVLAMCTSLILGGFRGVGAA